MARDSAEVEELPSLTGSKNNDATRPLPDHPVGSSVEESGNDTSCAAPSPLIRVTCTTSPVLTLNVGFTSPSIAPPPDTHKGHAPFGDFSPESEGYIRRVCSWPSIISLLGWYGSLPWALLIASGAGAGNISPVLYISWRSDGAGRPVGRWRRDAVSFAGAGADE
jgi:hypothetical protein